jgi:hypothetical protein
MYTFGSWGEQISKSDFPAESVTHFQPIVGVYVHIRSEAEGDDANGDNGDGDNGDGDDGNGDAPRKMNLRDV